MNFASARFSLWTFLAAVSMACAPPGAAGPGSAVQWGSGGDDAGLAPDSAPSAPGSPGLDAGPTSNPAQPSTQPTTVGNDDAGAQPSTAGNEDAASGTSPVGAGGGSSSGGSDSAGDAAPLQVTCTPVAGGTGAVSVNGATARQYYVDLPRNTSQPMALLFSWHGYNQAPLDFKNMVGFDPNGGSVPIVVVTPTDTGLFLPNGLDWFIEGSSGNVDFPYFQGMLSCLESEFSIDKTRVYSYGFSAGAVFTNLIASQWPHLFAATVSESGAWFSDPAEVASIVVGGPLVPWDWPALNAADRGDVLMTHGGPSDFATIISIEAAATAALPFLLKSDRTVVDCAHTAGHALDPLVSNQAIYEYLLAHQLGYASPWSQLPAGFPASCTLNLP